MNILVTGGCGYVGSELVKELLKGSNKIVVVDTQLFGNYLEIHPNLDILIQDFNYLNKQDLAQMDIIIHLAGVSNDPTAEFNPQLNYRSNAADAVLLGQKAKEAKVKKFIFASSCSVYGFVADRVISKEEDEPAPKFPYGISKIMAEKGLLSLMDSYFPVVILRKGTIGGGSSRMRLDLLVNTMVKTALQTGKVIVKNKSLWRPIVDIRDVVRAYIKSIEEDAYGIYNIVQGNFQIRDVGELVVKTLKKKKIEVELEVHDVPDLRNYKASGDKALKELNFQAYHSVDSTVCSILERLEGVDLNLDRFYNIKVFEKMEKEGMWLK